MRQPTILRVRPSWSQTEARRRISRRCSNKPYVRKGAACSLCSPAALSYPSLLCLLTAVSACRRCPAHWLRCSCLPVSALFSSDPNLTWMRWSQPNARYFSSLFNRFTPSARLRPFCLLFSLAALPPPLLSRALFPSCSVSLPSCFPFYLFRFVCSLSPALPCASDAQACTQ